MLAQFCGHALQAMGRSPVAQAHLSVQGFFIITVYISMCIFLITLVNFHLILKLNPKQITHSGCVIYLVRKPYKGVS